MLKEIRTFDKSLEELDFSHSNLEIINNILTHPDCGTILIGGVTGSGKTTTAYSLMQQVSAVDKTNYSIEDLIEYKVDNVQQFESKYRDFLKIFHTFPSETLDNLLVGELRSDEVAKITLEQGAVKGSKVISMMHSDSAEGIIDRLLDMRASRELIAESVSVIIVQKLVPKLCQNCKDVDIASSKLGCESCLDTRINGRIAVHGVVPFDDSILQTIISGDNLKDIENLSLMNLQHDIDEKIQAGLIPEYYVNKM